MVYLRFSFGFPCYIRMGTNADVSHSSNWPVLDAPPKQPRIANRLINPSPRATSQHIELVLGKERRCVDQSQIYQRRSHARCSGQWRPKWWAAELSFRTFGSRSSVDESHTDWSKVFSACPESGTPFWEDRRNALSIEQAVLFLSLSLWDQYGHFHQKNRDLSFLRASQTAKFHLHYESPPLYSGKRCGLDLARDPSYEVASGLLYFIQISRLRSCRHDREAW